jgi:heptosyltransferase-2
VKKILIVKIGAIGDVAMALPILTELHKQGADVSITWIAGKIVAPLIEATGLVDEIIIVEESKLLAGSFFTQCRALFSLWKTLLGRSFDQVLTFHADPRYKLLSLFVRSKDRRSWGTKQKRPMPLSGRYHAEETLQLLNPKEPGEFRAKFPQLKLPPSRVDLPERTLILLAPGGAKNTLADNALRRWPVEHYAELAVLLAPYPYHIVLMGSASDQWTLPYFQHLNISHVMGQLSLLECLSLLKQASLLITHDSGPLHLAKLVQCPAIGLFGPTNPHEKISPQENIRVLWGGEHLSCRPCYSGKHYAPCTSNECLKSLTPTRVLEETLHILQVPCPI